MTPRSRMDSALPWTFLLLLTLPWISSQSEPAVTVHCDYDEDPELREQFLDEGESLWFVFMSSNPKSNFTWYWNNSRDVLALSTQETQLVHAEGPALFLLNATQTLSGCFMAREKKSSGRVRDHHLLVSVMPPNSSKSPYGEMNFSGNSMVISCPDPVSDTCGKLNGTLSWYKDAVLLPNQESSHATVSGALEKDQGLYTCVCTWKHRQHLYRSVGSRQVYITKPSIAEVPVKILFPTEKKLWASADDPLKLNCSVFCGINVSHHLCRAWWETRPSSLNPERSNQTEVYSPKSSNRTVVTAVLTISQVSADDFKQQFVCFGRGPYDREEVSFTVHLKPRQTLGSLVTVGTCAFLLCVLVAVIVRSFSIDLALLARKFIPFREDSGGKAFDAYVVYQQEVQDKPTEEALTQFLSRDLPCVLEEQCGYRLFIHGRDDLPGEDRVEQVEEHMRKSRRLIVILTPGSGSEVTETYLRPEGYDWQVGLHQALVQRDLSVILIQLGDTGPGGYSHLPPALQHLIQRGAPLRWPQEPQAASANSRFWKRVRYLMPAAPVTRRPLSTA